MENKYYTPEIEEFHVGFEFEVLNNEGKFYIPGLAKNEWSSIESNFGIFTSVEKIQRLILDKQIRVKHLDREDIESLGWHKHQKTYFSFENKKIENHSNEHFLNDKLVLSDSYFLEITDSCIIIQDYDYEVIFKGTIKNKSELRKLMHQLNINSGGK